MVAFKAFSALAAIATGAALILALPGFGIHDAAASADRLNDRPLGTACSQQGWPYYETQCLRDSRRPAGKARAVSRIIAIDKLQRTSDVTSWWPLPSSAASMAGGAPAVLTTMIKDRDGRWKPIVTSLHLATR